MTCKSQSQRWASFLYTSKVRTTPTQWQLAPAQLWDALGVRHVRHCHGIAVHIWHASSTSTMSYVPQSQAPTFDLGKIHVGNDSMYWPRTWKQNEREWRGWKTLKQTSTDRVKMFYVVDSHALDSKPMELPAGCTFWYFLDVLRSAAGAQPGGWLRRGGAEVQRRSGLKFSQRKHC